MSDPPDPVDRSDPSEHRLPEGVRPVRYELTLAPDLGAARFEGTVDIEVDVVSATSTVTLNAVELDIREAWVDEGDRIACDVALDEERERLVLDLDREVATGPAVVHVAFEGVLNDQLKGFYRSTFTDPQGEERTLATTQFEATDARRAFPCWDEPAAKAVFSVTLDVADGLLAVSNAAESSRETLDGGLVRHRFADTMVMSTYLVAFVVGPLEVTAPVDAAGTQLRIVHPPGKAHLTAFATEVGRFSLEYLSGFYGIDYPGDKLDLVAIPDFAFGAMENLGCVTFREVLLLVDPETATQPELQNVVDVIAHELAHMWFGDLVTMDWWNGIWLNEAFATFMELKATDAFRPDWKRWVSFTTSRTAALDVDALLSTRAVEYPVGSPAEAEAMFDVLTYEKGAACVRMLEQHVGEGTFREGVGGYLRDHAYANTETTDLWDALERASGEPTRRTMDSWILQGGYPMVDVALDGTSLALGQRRFTYLAPPDGDQPLWSIPIALGHGGGGAARLDRVLLEAERQEITLDVEPEWVVANRGGSGFYRVRYDPALRAVLVDRAQSILEAVERYALVDDAWAFVLADTMTAPEWLDLAVAFSAERDLSVWQRLVGGLRGLDRLVEGESRSTLHRLAGELLDPVWAELGPSARDGDDDRTRQLRSTVLGALGGMAGDPAVLELARSIDGADGVAADPEMTAASAAVVAEHGDTRDYERLLARFADATDPQSEQRALQLLADFTDPELFARTLDLALSDDVRTQNAPYLLRRALANRVRGADAWRFVMARWDAMNERFPSNSIARMLEGVRALDRPGLADEVAGFLDEHPVPQGAQIVEQHRERLAVNVATREREEPRLAARLG